MDYISYGKLRVFLGEYMISKATNDEFRFDGDAWKKAGGGKARWPSAETPQEQIKHGFAATREQYVGGRGPCGPA